MRLALFQPDIPQNVGACIRLSACFGVVLEGPMGAVVFWTILGLAHSQTAEEPEATAPLQADRETASA